MRTRSTEEKILNPSTDTTMRFHEGKPMNVLSFLKRCRHPFGHPTPDAQRLESATKQAKPRRKLKIVSVLALCIEVLGH